MNSSDPIITISILLALALVGGMVAHRLRQPVMMGYLLIGIVVGPHALGLINNLDVVESAAAIGVALLMFTLGLEISISQLREVGKIGLWGGILQIVLTIVLSVIAGTLVFHWSFTQSTLFGLIISLSSTAVCMKILMERGELSSAHGRIMLSMLILQDIAVVFMVMVMPMIGDDIHSLPFQLAVDAGKIVIFIAVAIILGRWVLPWLLGRVGGVRARELFLLTVLVLCFGAATATQYFGFSMVFGAFLIGLVLRETRFVHQALAEITPLRDVFATLFFVSLGMLLDPQFLMNNWPDVLAVVVAVVIVKMIAVYSVVRMFGYGHRIAVLVGGGIFQVGEFGFILAQMGLNAGEVSAQFNSLILSATVITMLLTPLAISLISFLYPKISSRKRNAATVSRVRAVLSSPEGSDIGDRVIIAGYGRVGQSVAQGMEDAGIPYLIIDIDPELIHEAGIHELPRIYGDATNRHVLSQSGLNKAKALVITYPDPIAVLTTAKLALSIKPDINILARVHRPKEADALKRLGVSELISPEYEASYRFTKRLLNITGVEKDERKRILAQIRLDQEITEAELD